MESRTPGLIVFEDIFSSRVNPPGQTQRGRPFEDVNVHILRAESAKPSMVNWSSVIKQHLDISKKPLKLKPQARVDASTYLPHP